MNVATDNLSMLTLALKKGDTEAYRQLVQLMGDALHLYAQRIVGDPGTAQDIVQDALLRIYKFRKRLDVNLDLRGLCFRTVRNLARDYICSVNLRLKCERKAEDMRSSKDQRQNKLASEAWDIAEQLPDNLREVIDLRFTFGLSRAEVAEALDIPEGTVATRQRNALAEVKQKLTARSVSPAMLAASPLSELLTSGGQASLSNPYTPNLLSMENVIMTAIRRTKMKTAGFAASAALLALFAVGFVAASITGGSTVPADSTIASSDTGSTTGGNTDAGRNASKHSNKTNREATPAEPAGTPSFDSNTSDGPSNKSNSTTPTPEPEEVLEHKDQPESPPLPVQPENKPVGMAPRFESLPDTIAIVGKDYMYMIETIGQPHPEITAKALPAWLTLEDGLLHGTPSAKDATPGALITLYANNGVKPVAEQRFQLLVGTAPVITSKPVETAEAGVSYSYTITVTGTPAAKIEASGLPDWLTLKSGVLSGTPSNSHGGVSGPITITASNDVEPKATQEFKITVNTPPVFVSKPIEEIKIGVEYRYEIKLEGIPAAELSVSRLPTWLKLDGYTLSGIPRTGDIGKSKRITLKAKNGIGKTARQSFKVEVLDDPDYCQVPWTIEDAKNFVHVGMKYTITMTDTSMFPSREGLVGPTPVTTKVSVHVVTGVSDKGFTTDSTTTETKTGTGMKRKPEVTKGTDNFHSWLVTMDCQYALPLNGTEFKRDEVSLKVGNKKVKCVQFSNANRAKDRANGMDVEISGCFSPLYPFMAIKTTWKCIAVLPGTSPHTDITTFELTEVIPAKKKK